MLRVALYTTACASLMAAPAHADFDFPDFKDPTGLEFVEDASVSEGVITISDNLDFSKGAVWFTDRKQRVDRGFETTFTFGAKDINGLGADGFAFVVQNERPDAIGGAGGAIGYGSNVFFDEIGISNSIAVEIDMWDNRRGNDWDDVDDRHLSIQTDGLNPNRPEQEFSLGFASIRANIEDQSPHVCKIVYVDNTFSVFIDDLMTPDLVVEDIDLSSLLDLDNGSAWVGLTSASAGVQDAQDHLLFSWNFIEIPAPGSALLMLTAGSLCAGRRTRK